jgi:transcriptional regulator with XRE-family HTH domain
MRDDSTTGDRVRRLRKLRGMTQSDLARVSRLSLRTVKDIEGGTYATVRNETLHKIATALRVYTSDLTSPGQPEYQPVPGGRSPGCSATRCPSIPARTAGRPGRGH